MARVISDNVEARVNVNEETNYGLITATANKNTTPEAAEAKIRIYKPPEKDVPEYGDDVRLFINEELVYRGIVDSISYQEGDSPRDIQLTCYDVIKSMKNETFTSSFASSKENVKEAGNTSFGDELTKEEYINEKPISRHVEEICHEVFSNLDGYNIEDDLILTFNTDVVKARNDLELEAGDDYWPHNTANKTEVGVGKDVENFGVILDIKEENCKKALDKVAEIAGGIWYVNHENKIVFGKPEVHEENQDGTPYPLNYILERDDGESQMPYSGVKVIGADITRVEVRAKGITEETNVEVEGKDYAVPRNKSTRRYKPTVVKKGSEPYYKYEDADIKTAKQAEKVAKNLYSKIKNKENKGSVEAVVDTAKIKPYMIVRYPEELDGHMFYVDSVKHIVNNQDGFITKVNIGSLVDPEEIEEA